MTRIKRKKVNRNVSAQMGGASLSNSGGPEADGHVEPRRHPAPFPPRIIEVIDALLREYCPEGGTLLDPFVGIGGISKVQGPWSIYGVEIEPEWAIQAEEAGVDVHVGDSKSLPWEDGSFDVIATSPAYGNRMADAYAPHMLDTKHRKRRSYRIYLGRPLSPNNGGAWHWGDCYRILHSWVWEECVRVLREGGIFILNCKNHMRKKELQLVTEWHLETLQNLGLKLLTVKEVPLKGDQNTNSMRSRGVRVVDYETVAVLRKEEETQ